MKTGELKLINNYIDKANPKFELNGAFLDKVNKKIVSTDTKALIIYENEELNAEGIINKSAIELALKTATTKKEKEVIFHNRNGEMYNFGNRQIIDIQTVISEEKDNRNGAIISIPEIINTYPQYERIIPSYPDKKSIKTTPIALMRDVASAGIILDLKYIQPFIDYLELRNYKEAMVYYKDSVSPVLFECKNIKLIVMPING